MTATSTPTEPTRRPLIRALSMLLAALSLAVGPIGAAQDRPTTPASAPNPNPAAAALDQQRVELAKRARNSVCAVFSLSVRLGDWSHIMGGSGFVVSNRGHILTDLSVVGSLSSVSVCLPGLRLFRAKVLGRDPLNGIALLELENPPADALAKLVPLELAGGDTATTKVGTTAYSLGNPYSSLFNDDQIAFSAGEISAVGRLKNSDASITRYFGTVYETTCAVNDGSFGGPLLDAHGKVLGLITRCYSTSRWLGCAVPASQIAAALPELRRGQSPAAASAGLTVENTVADDEAPGAAKISAITAGSPAEAAGLKVGDIVLRVDEDRLTDGAAGLNLLFGKLPVGTRVTLVLKGAGRLRFVSFVLAPK